ncbi:hypothetical protein BJV78DRAFT_1364188 [Lactifluus subvellereus]|nr:hypothetical protein BJV78DRAFT_1364188 [Lactifluus subvellereus]
MPRALGYFSEYLFDHTPNEAFERFVLSSPVNFGSDLPANDVQDTQNAVKQGNKHPELLLLAGLVQYIPSSTWLTASNLTSRAKLQKSEQTELELPSFFAKLPRPGFSTALTSTLSTLRIVTPAFEEKRPMFAFLHRIHEHQRLGPSALGGSSMGTPLFWQIPATTLKKLEGMVEEVAWGNVIWYGVGGWQAHGDVDRPFNADFFFSSCHLRNLLLTLVLPSEDLPYPPAPLARHLTLLKAYLATCAGWYTSRGNGPLPIEEFYSATHDRLIGASPLLQRTSPPISLAQASQRSRRTAVRSFAAFATRWSGRPAGYFAGGDEDGLEGREVLDGTFFVHVASLTLDQLGWAYESGQGPGRWGFLCAFLPSTVHPTAEGDALAQ